MKLQIVGKRQVGQKQASRDINYTCFPHSEIGILIAFDAGRANVMRLFMDPKIPSTVYLLNLEANFVTRTGDEWRYYNPNWNFASKLLVPSKGSERQSFLVASDSRTGSA